MSVSAGAPWFPRVTNAATSQAACQMVRDQKYYLGNIPCAPKTPQHAGTWNRRETVVMSVWLCPGCARQFRRVGQSHECAPAMTMADYFSTGPPLERPIFEAVVAALANVGPVTVEPVSVGIFLKRAQTFAQLRPMQQWVALSFGLRRRATHRTITRKLIAYHGRYHHVANLRSVSDFDGALADLLIEAYTQSPDV